MDAKNVFYLLIETDDIVYDIGANIGQSVMNIYELLGEKGKLLSFEPHPELYKKLQENVDKLGRNNIETFPMAISDCCGKASFFFGNAVFAEQASTLIKGLATPERLGEKIEEVVVETITVDQFSKGEYPDFIKIDVEGAESKVLKGMGECIASAKPTILFEYGMDLDEKEIPKHITVLKEEGYKFYFAELTVFLTKPASWEHCLNTENDNLDDKLILFDIEELPGPASLKSLTGNILAVKRQNISEKINAQRTVALNDAIPLMTKPKRSIKTKVIKYMPLFLLKPYRKIKRLFIK